MGSQPGRSGRQALGRAGEQQAAEWYQAHGYRLVTRNWRGSGGELDLIVRLGRTVAFCEVKTRSTARFGVPAEAVTAVKQARIRRLAGQWLAGQRGTAGWDGPVQVRFDVAAILDGAIQVIEGAF